MPDPVRLTKTHSEVPLIGVQFANARTSFLTPGEILTSVYIIEATQGIGISSVTNTGSEVRFYVSSGTPRNTYVVDIAALTNGGRQVVRSFQLEIVETRWLI